MWIIAFKPVNFRSMPLNSSIAYYTGQKEIGSYRNIILKVVTNSRMKYTQINNDIVVLVLEKEYDIFEFTTTR